MVLVWTLIYKKKEENNDPQLALQLKMKMLALKQHGTSLVNLTCHVYLLLVSLFLLPLKNLAVI